MTYVPVNEVTEARRPTQRQCWCTAWWTGFLAGASSISVSDSLPVSGAHAEQMSPPRVRTATPTPDAADFRREEFRRVDEFEVDRGGQYEREQCEECDGDHRAGVGEGDEGCEQGRRADVEQGADGGVSTVFRGDQLAHAAPPGPVDVRARQDTGAEVAPDDGCGFLGAAVLGEPRR
ncbi:hypothetical protein [Streptomyces sp. NPDC021212]|uniref:hypothetical protein n=1 Tax=Streptomyces sp. NPDC021212 TaxID=3365118 RepID=UPI0037A6D29D